MQNWDELCARSVVETPRFSKPIYVSSNLTEHSKIDEYKIDKMCARSVVETLRFPKPKYAGSNPVEHSI